MLAVASLSIIFSILIDSAIAVRPSSPTTLQGLIPTRHIINNGHCVLIFQCIIILGCVLSKQDTIYCYAGAKFPSDKHYLDKTNGLYRMNVTGNEQLDSWIVVDYYDKERKPLPANAAFAVSSQPDGSPGMMTYGGDGANGVRDFGTALFYNADAGSWRTLRSKPQSRYT